MSGNATIAVVAITGGSTALRVLSDQSIADKPAALFKVTTGAFILGAVLSLLEGAAPGLASVIGLTIVLAALMFNGTAVLSATSHLLGT